MSGNLLPAAAEIKLRPESGQILVHEGLNQHPGKDESHQSCLESCNGDGAA